MGIVAVLFAVVVLGWMSLAVLNGAASLVNTAMLIGKPAKSPQVSGVSPGTGMHRHIPRQKPVPPPRALPDGTRALLRLLEEQHAKHH